MQIQKNFLTPNKYSRPQIELKRVNGVVVHYVGNAGSSAIANRNYFEGNKNRQIYASSHYIIGLNGEIIMCVPENEIAYCSNNRNKDTISIECCHLKEDGKFNSKTLESLTYLLKDIIKRYDLKINDVIRHYDITGKMCPLYFVKNEGEWEIFKKNLFELENNLINELYSLGIISNKEYWQKGINEVKYLEILIENSLNKIKQKEKIDVNKALQILIENEVINNKDYWLKNIKLYKYLDILIITLAEKLN